MAGNRGFYSPAPVGWSDRNTTAINTLMQIMFPRAGPLVEGVRRRHVGGYIHAMPMTAPLPAATCGAMILAAGRGERMRPLTDACPKPLLAVRGKPLMQWPIEALARAGVHDILVNTAWLGERIETYFSNPSVAWAPDTTPMATHGVADTLIRLVYSHEGRDFGGALETAGGIVRALPHLANPFWLLAGDIFAPTFAFSDADRRTFMISDALAHIWLVPNPPHNLRGDFTLEHDGLAGNDGSTRHTYSTMGLFRHALFAPPYCAIPPGNPEGIKAALAPMLRAAIHDGKVSAQLYTGPWTDVGTPERLAQLQNTRVP